MQTTEKTPRMGRNEIIVDLDCGLSSGLISLSPHSRTRHMKGYHALHCGEDGPTRTPKYGLPIVRALAPNDMYSSMRAGNNLGSNSLIWEELSCSWASFDVSGLYP